MNEPPAASGRLQFKWPEFQSFGLEKSVVAAMSQNWDDRFDTMCGAAIRNSGSCPVLDSGVHALLYGETENVVNNES